MLRNISKTVAQIFFNWTPLLALLVVLACDSGTGTDSKGSNPLSKQETAINLTIGGESGSSFATAIAVSGSAGNTLYSEARFNPATLVKDARGDLSYYTVGNDGIEIAIGNPATYTLPTTATVTIVIKAAGDNDYNSKSLYFRITVTPAPLTLATGEELENANENNIIITSDNAAGAARDGSTPARAAVINNSNTDFVDGVEVTLTDFVKGSTGATYDVLTGNGSALDPPVTGVTITTAHTIVGDDGLMFKITKGDDILYLRVQAVNSSVLKPEADLTNNNTIIITNNAAGAARDGSSVARAAVINNSDTALADGVEVTLTDFLRGSTGATYDVLTGNGSALDPPVENIDIATAHTIVGDDGFVFKITVPASDNVRGVLYLRVQAVSSFALKTDEELSNNDTITTSNNAAGAARDGSDAAQAAVINNSDTALVDGAEVTLTDFVKSSTGATYDVLRGNGSALDPPVTGVAIATAHTIVGDAGLVFKITDGGDDETRAATQPLYLRVQAVSSLALKTQAELTNSNTITITNNAADNPRNGSSRAQAAVINSAPALVDGGSVDLSKFVTSSTNAIYDVLDQDGSALDPPVTGVGIATAHSIVGDAGLVFKITDSGDDATRAATQPLYLRVQAESPLALKTQRELINSNRITITNNAAGNPRDGSNAAQAAVINHRRIPLADGVEVTLTDFLKGSTGATYDVLKQDESALDFPVENIDIATAHKIVGNAGLVFKITVPGSDTVRDSTLYLRVRAVSSLAFKSSDGDNGYTLDQTIEGEDGSDVDSATVLTKKGNATLTAGQELNLSELVEGASSGVIYREGYNAVDFAQSSNNITTPSAYTLPGSGSTIVVGIIDFGDDQVRPNVLYMSITVN